MTCCNTSGLVYCGQWVVVLLLLIMAHEQSVVLKKMREHAVYQ